MIKKDTPKGTQVAYKYRTLSEEFGFVMKTTGNFAFCRFWTKGKPGILRTRANNEPVQFEDLIEFNSVTPGKLEETVKWIDEQDSLIVDDAGMMYSIKSKGHYMTWTTEVSDGFLLLVADRGRINLEDPGADTPAMVYICGRDGKLLASATLNYALDTGMLDGHRATRMINPEEMEWLNEIAESVDAFLDQPDEPIK